MRKLESVLGKLKKIGIIIAFFLMLIGFTGFIGGMLITLSLIDYNKELPLGDTQGIVVDKADRIYVGLGFYGKVQVYDKNGHFIRNWKVEASGGSFRVNLTKEQNILIATARGDKQILYDSSGKILSKDIIKSIYSTSKGSGDTYIKDQKLKYEITGMIFPKISIATPDKRVIVDQGVVLKLMNGPFPVWFILIVGTGLMLLLIKTAYAGRLKSNPTVT